jgi:hypothetical protein
MTHDFGSGLIAWHFDSEFGRNKNKKNRQRMPSQNALFAINILYESASLRNHNCSAMHRRKLMLLQLLPY